MGKIVLLNRPIWVVEKSDKEGDKRNLVELFGFVITQRCIELGCNAEHIDCYLDYICGASKWEQEGNYTDGFTWLSNQNGGTYDIFNPFIQRYLKRARQQKYLTYLVFETDIEKETEGIVDGEFLISRELYNYIIENGKIIDIGCQNSLENRGKEGGLT